MNLHISGCLHVYVRVCVCILYFLYIHNYDVEARRAFGIDCYGHWQMWSIWELYPAVRKTDFYWLSSLYVYICVCISNDVLYHDDVFKLNSIKFALENIEYRILRLTKH